MEFCSGQTLQDYLDKRNVKEGFEFVTKESDGNSVGIFDRVSNYRIF
jgi:hypothetical protein